MRILILTNHSFMFWQFRRELTAELSKDNQVYLSLPFGDHVEDLKALGCTLIDTPISRRGINPFTDWRLWKSYMALIKQINPDKVITYSIKPNVYGGLVCKKLGIPYYTNVQGLGTAFQHPVLASFVSFLYKRALRDAKTVFFENEDNADFFRKKRLVADKSICVLPGAGINLSFFDCQEYPDNDLFHFLFLGRIMREKGVEELFYAVRRLQEEKYRFHLDLVGFFENEYKQQVDELIADGIATFHGFQQDPRPFYKMVDCVVLPSYHEGMSNVLLEAAATGRPIITSDIPGCREAVINNVTGMLATAKDRETLYQAMKSMLALSPETRRKMGLDGRDHVHAVFEKNKVVTMTLNEIYR